MATTVIKKGQPGSKAIFKDSFLMHKLHSLSGVIPIGAFMVFHLVANSYSLRGEVEFNTVVKVIGYFPFVQVVEIVGIFLPILFHAIYGFFIVAEAQSPGGNLAHYGYSRNWFYYLQRWSGVVAFAYIVYHVWSTTGHRWGYEFSGQPDAAAKAHAVISYMGMAYRFASIGYLLTYLVGITAAVFHFANGMFNFGIRWGITIGAQAQRISAMLWWAIGLGLTVIACATAINFHVKGNNFPLMQAGATQPTYVNLRSEYSSLEELVEKNKEEAIRKTPVESRPDTNAADDGAPMSGAAEGGAGVTPAAQ